MMRVIKMKKLLSVVIAVILINFIFTGCKTRENDRRSEYIKYQKSFFDTFDTLTQVVGYTKTEEEFDSYVERIHERFRELHKLYDIYNNYEGINNIKSINDNAGIQPVKVDKEIIDLILFSKDWYDRTEGHVNIALGPVLRIWHDYREMGEFNPVDAKLPPMEKLREAARYTDINKVIVDTESSTVYLADKNMSLDVGAVAKGYATEIVAQEIMKEGFNSGILSPGGNVRVLGKPLDGIRDKWGVAIQNPDKSILPDNENILDTAFLNNASVVSSGDYQRYYIVNGKPIHHLINPKTLMPAEYYRAVTVVTEDAGLGDLLSTAVFLMPYEKSRNLVEGIEGVEALWVMQDNNIQITKGMEDILYSYGASGSEKK